MEGNNFNNMNVENNQDNIQPNVGNNQPQVEPVIQVTPQTPAAPTAIPSTTAQLGNENNTTPNTGITPNNQDNGKKKNPILFIILGLVLVAVIGIVVFFLLTNNDKEENKDTDKKTEEQENKPTAELNWSGVYENDNGYITIYQLDNEEFEFNAMIGSNSISGVAQIDGNTAEAEIFDSYTFVLNENSVEFSSTDEDIETNSYPKVKDYTKEDYFTDNYGNITLLENGLNGVFEKDELTITIYQTSEESANITISKNNYYFQRNIEIIDGKLVHEDNFFDDVETINATITNDTLTITASSSDPESILNEISGSYTLTKKVTIDDILNQEI